MTRELAILEKLEKDLNLKQLQIKSLLNITQAINENVSAEGLFGMYESFLGWEMGVTRMALLVNESGDWKCRSSIQSDGLELIEQGVIEEALNIQRLTTVKNKDYKLLSKFDIVVPVYHKEEPLSFALIGGIKKEDDLYDKLQFITTITNIITVAIENKRLFKQQLIQETYKKEIELASEVQKMLIPEGMPKGLYYDIASIYKPHYNVGGDYIDFIHLPRGDFIICIADISGKGVSAALLMANFQAIVRSLVNKYDDLEALVRDINNSVNKITKGDKFLTLFIAKVEKTKDKITYVNAGHFPPLVVGENRLELLNKGCTVIGAFEELPFLEKGTVDLTDEFVLMTFTDGLTDIQNEKGEYFDEKCVKDFLQENWKSNSEEINAKLLLALDVYKGQQVFPDDIAVLTCKFYDEE